jgi:hypothetical protein
VGLEKLGEGAIDKVNVENRGGVITYPVKNVVIKYYMKHY